MLSRNIFKKAILLIIVVLLVGCNRASSAPPDVGEINTSPSTTTITAGDKVALTIPVAGSGLEFEWSVLGGSLTDPTQPNVIYTAPDSPGPDTVTVKVKYDGGTIIKNITFNVVEPPASTATDTPVPADTPTPTALPKPINCNLAPITKNLFPQLANESGQFPIYGPETETRFLCKAVYDIVHNDGPMAVHIKYENFENNFGWWGVATPNGYNASSYSQICLWAFAQEPNQSFRLKMRDTAKHEKGIIISLEKTNEWEEVCVEITEFVKLGINVNNLDNVNLGFEASTGSAEVWIAELEFDPFLQTSTFTPVTTGISTIPIAQDTLAPNTTGTPKLTYTLTPTVHMETPNATQTIQNIFDEVDRQFQNIKSNIAYNAPETMKLDETVTVELLLNPSFTQPQLATEVVQRSEQRGEYVTSTAEPSKPITKQGEEPVIVTSEIQITNRMKAELKSKDPDAFIIQASHDSAEQPISNIETTKWRWNVTAKKMGIQTLELVIYRLIKVEDTDNWREVESFQEDIVVEVTPSEWLRETLGLDWRWLLTTLLIPFFFWWINNRRKKENENKAS